MSVPAYTDFNLHDITDPEDEAPEESLDLNQTIGSQNFMAGNRWFLTRRLWGVANQRTHFHYGLFTTMRQAVLATRASRSNSGTRLNSCPRSSRTR
jgi:hypothetical protein